MSEDIHIDEGFAVSIRLDKKAPCAGTVTKHKEAEEDRPVIVMWREDYDAIVGELESERRWAEHYFREWEKAKKELEELKKAGVYSGDSLENGDT